MKKDLTIFSHISTSFSDISIDLNNYDIDEVAMTLVNATDFIYVGLYKNFKNIYIEVKENPTPGTISYEYYNGSAWVALTVTDETKNFTRSGYVYFDIPSDLVATTINSKELFYIRMTGNIVVTLNGINMVFSNDNDLKEHYRSIMDYVGTDSSFIAIHQASRKDIVQQIRNSGKTKISSIDGNLSDLNVWDFMRPDQLRNASTYKCLSKIFAGVSDNSEGKFLQLSRSFNKQYQSAIETFLLTIDSDDDGIESSSEQNGAVTVSRIVYA